MKVLVLGAAGRAGRAAVYSLLRMDGVERIFMADNNAEALTKLAADLGHMPVSPRFLDAENVRGLHERMTEADLVLGCLGPFHRHEKAIVEAAVSARRDYISLCDDPAAAAAAFSLGAEAEKKDVRVLCGCGLTPGLSNLLARRAWSQMEVADALDMAWYLQMGSNLGMATLEHLLYIFGIKALLYERGERKEARAGSREEFIEFPPPIGWKMVGFVGHPEQITVPHSIGGFSDVFFRAGIGEGGKGLTLRSLAWLGEGERPEPWGTALLAVARGVIRRGGDSCLTALRVTARGMREGAEYKVIRAVVGDYYIISGRVLAAAVELYRDGNWPPGVYPPEKVLDSPAFFNLLYRRGIRIMAGEEEGDLDPTSARPMMA